MLDDLDRIAWDSKARPNSDNARSVPEALRRIGAADSSEAAKRSYHAFLYAIGNNHAGSYYPVVLDTVPFLASMLDSSNPWARATVLDILIDLVGSFGPEQGYETFERPSRSRASVRTVLEESIVGLLPTVEGMVGDSKNDSRTRELARHLLELITDVS